VEDRANPKELKEREREREGERVEREVCALSMKADWRVKRGSKPNSKGEWQWQATKPVSQPEDDDEVVVAGWFSRYDPSSCLCAFIAAKALLAGCSDGWSAGYGSLLKTTTAAGAFIVVAATSDRRFFTPTKSFTESERERERENEISAARRTPNIGSNSLVTNGTFAFHPPTLSYIHALYAYTTKYRDDESSNRILFVGKSMQALRLCVVVVVGGGGG
jgi:hypothetical protein